MQGARPSAEPASGGFAERDPALRRVDVVASLDGGLGARLKWPHAFGGDQSDWKRLAWMLNMRA